MNCFVGVLQDFRGKISRKHSKVLKHVFFVRNVEFLEVAFN